MIKEFKEFIMKGNVLELAVAVIIAGVFGAVITSFTQDVLMPPIGLMLGDTDFSEMAFILQEGVTNAEGEVVQAEVAIRYGLLINKIITFLITAFALFMVIKAYNKSQAPPEAPAPAGPTQEELLMQIRDLLQK